MDPQQRAALERAAAADERTASGLARKLIVKWLAQNGWLEPIPKELEP